MDEQSVNTAGKELLDATQEAVIGAADNVENNFKKHHSRNWGRTRSLLPVARILGRNGFCDGGGRVVYPAEKALFGFWGNILPKRPDVSPMPRILKPRRGSCWRLMRKKLEGIDDETAAVVKKSQKREISALKKNLTAELEQRLDAQEKTAKQRIEGERVPCRKRAGGNCQPPERRVVGKALTAHHDEPTRRKLIDQSIDLIDSL